jgi:hypothetical protein
MFERTTIKLLVAIAGGYLCVWLPYVVWQDKLPAFLTAPYAALGLGQAIPVYVLSGMGVPGLLESNGHCGWGWCGPTVLGSVVLAIFWVVVVWLIAWLISIGTSSFSKGASFPP